MALFWPPMFIANRGYHSDTKAAILLATSTTNVKQKISRKQRERESNTILKRIERKKNNKRTTIFYERNIKDLY